MLSCMNRLNTERRAQIVRCLVDGNSIRATCRITGVEKRTVLRLLEQVGAACAEYQDRTLRNLKCRRIQCDEIWSFVGMKDKAAKYRGINQFGIGDVWTWTAIDADTKLVPCWFLGGRDGGAAYEFMKDLEERLTSRVQLTTDGHAAYLDAVDSNFGVGVDYAMLIKLYGQDPAEDERRYSPAKCIGAEPHVIIGNPDPDHISTSYVERQNLTMRMGIRRFTRLTNGFSKKVENHAHHIALHFMYYNFARVHQTLRVTPAMEAKVALPGGKEAPVADHVWTVEEIVALIPDQEAPVILK